MHELSIAMSIVDVASSEATQRGAARVSAVHLKLGPLSGVVRDALLFSFEVAGEGTPCEGARLLIEEIPVRVFCGQCSATCTIESIQLFACQVCGTLSNNVVQGRELQVVALEIEEFIKPPTPVLVRSGAGMFPSISVDRGGNDAAKIN